MINYNNINLSLRKKWSWNQWWVRKGYLILGLSPVDISKKRDAQFSLLTVKKERNFVLEKREGRGDPELQRGHPESSWDGEVEKFSPSPAPLSETGISQTPAWNLIEQSGLGKGVLLFFKLRFWKPSPHSAVLDQRKRKFLQKRQNCIFLRLCKKTPNHNLGLWGDCIFVLLLFSLSLPGEKFQEFFWVFSAFLQFD